jgi:hypothetical protein
MQVKGRAISSTRTLARRLAGIKVEDLSLSRKRDGGNGAFKGDFYVYIRNPHISALAPFHGIGQDRGNLSLLYIPKAL